MDRCGNRVGEEGRGEERVRRDNGKEEERGEGGGESREGWRRRKGRARLMTERGGREGPSEGDDGGDSVSRDDAKFW